MTRFAFLFSMLAISGALINASPIGPEKGTYTGSATYTEQGLGACGKTTTDSELVVAVSEAFFNSWPGYNGKNPNDNPICMRRLIALYKGTEVEATVTDVSVGGGEYDLNFSPAVFKNLAPEKEGIIYGVKWFMP